ncbi:MAG: hypothetical protein LDL22_08550, partial [Hyphomicrobiales bacterium]|nr:hypothetical protein [Hyphomicrobiales bacterium]
MAGLLMALWACGRPDRAGPESGAGSVFRAAAKLVAVSRSLTSVQVQAGLPANMRGRESARLITQPGKAFRAPEHDE